jgi:hypothetical protein
MLAALIARQQALGENDVEFAVRLGLPRSTWQAYRAGRIPLTIRLAVATQRAFPDMTAHVRSFVLSDASGLSELARLLECESVEVA